MSKSEMKRRNVMSGRPIDEGVDKPREFKLHFDYGNAEVELASEKAWIKNRETMHVREVTPGSISLTREQLRDAWNKASYCSDGTTDQELLEKILFGKADHE